MPHDVRGASVLMPAHVHRTSSGHGGPVPLRHTEPRVVQTIVHSTGAQCRGDLVGRPAGAVHVRSPSWITCGRCARRWQGDLPRWNRRCQARGGMTDDVDPQRPHDDRIDPHPALRAGLSQPGRDVSLLLRWEQPGASCRFAQPSRPLSAPSGAERVRVRWGPNHRTATHRVAPTRRAYSRVRYTHEHGTATDLFVVQARRRQRKGLMGCQRSIRSGNPLLVLREN